LGEPIVAVLTIANEATETVHLDLGIGYKENLRRAAAHSSHDVLDFMTVGLPLAY
jgi:hypothetical protein